MLCIKNYEGLAVRFVMLRHRTYQNHLECDDAHDELTAEEIEE